MATATSRLPVPDQRVFRIFISYASEDLAIATAVSSCFKTALPDFFAEVNFDKDFLEPGSAFQAQLESKLQVTNVLIIVYTGAEKRSHGYTGWEVGYFDRILRTDPCDRKKISLYLFGPPAVTAPEQGIPSDSPKTNSSSARRSLRPRSASPPTNPSARRLAKSGSRQHRAERLPEAATEA